MYILGGISLFFKNRLFRKDIEPRCFYCLYASKLDEENMTCRKRGIVKQIGKCRSFRYDPLGRIPPKPAVLRFNFEDSDFLLEENDED